MRSLRSILILAILGVAAIATPARAQTPCSIDAECDDGDLCTGTELCVSGFCEAGTPVVCTALDQCHVVGTCDPLTGLCSDPEATDGTVCNDTDLCTTDDTCQAGTCTGDPVVCTALDQCHVAGTCDSGTGLCSNPPATDGTTCSDGDLCTTADSCQAGSCTGTAVVCTALDQCHVAGTCDSGTGLCSNPPATDGTTCSDGDLCTTADSCQAGSCTGTAVVCTALDQCHVAGTCDSGTGLCSNPPATDGTTCSDGDLCTTADSCQAGSCTGTAVVCTALDQCHVAGTCDSGTGLCSNPPATDGTTCSDGDLCTTADSCQAGSCTGTAVVCTALDQCHVAGTCDSGTGLCSNPPATDGTTCSDGDLCTTADSCQAGSCTGTAVVCTALDQCHVAGTCDSGTGLCSNPPATDGTTCSDGSLCTTADSCQAGTCTGTAIVCTALDQCHVAGTCDPGTGVCSNPTAPDGSACSDGSLCTTADSCLLGLCAGTAIVCTASDQCHTAGACDPLTGTCSNPALPDGTTCSDGLFCTVGETCTAGTCGGSIARDCSFRTNQCNTGVCDDGINDCIAQPSNEGLACSDADSCTVSDHCTLGVCAGTGVVDCATPRIVVANNGAATATIIRSTDMTVEGTPATGIAPQDVAIAPSGLVAYVTNNATDTVSVVDLQTDTTVATIAVDIEPIGIAASPDGQFVYVANNGADSISVISAASNSLLRTIQLDPTATLAPFGPFDIAVTPNGAFLYITNVLHNTVSVIRTIDDFIVAEVPVARRPQGIAISPNGAFALIANASDALVAVFRLLDNAVVATIPVGTAPFGVAFTADGGSAFVTNAVSNTVSRIRTADLRVVATIPVPGNPAGITVAGTGNRAYVASTGANRVTEINTAGNSLGRSVVVGAAPVGLAVTGSTILQVFGSASPGTVAPGSPVTFTFTYSNAGNRPALNATLSATIPTTATFATASAGGTVNGNTVQWTIGTLAAGSSGQVSFSATVHSPLAPGTQVSSTATIADDQTNSAQGTATAVVDSDPQYSLGKTADNDPVAAGGTLNYTITYANNASANADGAGVSIAETYDPNFVFLSSIPAPIAGTNNQWAVGSLPVGASGTIRINGVVRSPLSNGTLLRNTVTLRDAFNTQTTASLTTAVAASPALAVALADDHDPVAAGSEVTYTINYTNTGNENAAGVGVVATYDPNVVFVRATPAPDAGSTNQWTIGTLNTGANGVIAVTVRAAGVLPNGTILTNQATIQSTSGANANATENTIVSSAPALNVSLTDAPDPVATGEILTYTITYSNTGSDVAAGATVVASYDPGVTFQSAVPPPTTDTNKWMVGDLPVGGGGTITVSVLVTAPLGSIVQSGADIAATGGTGASATANTTVQITPILNLTATDSADPIGAGDLLTYTLRYGNTGNSPATNTLLTAIYDANVTFVSASPPPDAGTNNQWTLGSVIDGTTGQATVTVRVRSPLPNGTLLGVQGVLTADGPLSTNASQSTTVQSAPALSLTKQDSADPVPPQSNITYTVTYANSGNEDTTGVIVSEAYDPLVTFVSAVPAPDVGTTNRWTFPTLAGGQTSTIQITVRVPLVPNGTTVTNTASIRDGAGRSATATEQTTISSPIFALDAADSADPVSPGEPVQYTVNYGNISGAIQTGVVLQAVLPAGFVLDEATPAPAVGTTWVLGTVPVGGAGTIVIRGFFNAGASLTQATFQVTNPHGAAFTAESTTVEGQPGISVKRLTLRQSGRNDSWVLRTRVRVPDLDELEGQLVEVSIAGPGGINHVPPMQVGPLHVTTLATYKYVGDVPGFGNVKVTLLTGGTKSWALKVRCKGSRILPTFPNERRFFVVARVGTAGWISETLDFRDLVPLVVRRYP